MKKYAPFTLKRNKNVKEVHLASSQRKSSYMKIILTDSPFHSNIYGRGESLFIDSLFFFFY